MCPLPLSASKDTFRVCEAAKELLNFIDELINEDMKNITAKTPEQQLHDLERQIPPQPIDEEAEIERTIQFLEDYSSMIVDDIERRRIAGHIPKPNDYCVDTCSLKPSTDKIDFSQWLEYNDERKGGMTAALNECANCLDALLYGHSKLYAYHLNKGYIIE